MPRRLLPKLTRARSTAALAIMLGLAATPHLAAQPAVSPAAQGTRRSVRVLSFSDYHSHALPFWSEGRPAQAGIARAVAYLRAARSAGHTLVVSGGDMLNRGAPLWSDEYRCVEWPWLDGLVDAMALGNHDLDYGPAAFDTCRGSVRFPLLSANLQGPSGQPLLTTTAGRPYLVHELDSLKLGVFAVAGPDMQRLVRAADLPAGARWADATATAREVVERLRGVEGVDAVLLIGHQTREEDAALARAVPGIDLVLGSHSHLKSDLETLPGSRTRYLSPFQYLTYVAEARLDFIGRRLQHISGRLVRLDETLPEDPQVAARVHQLQGELRRRHAQRFARLGQAAAEIAVQGVERGECPLGNWATDTLRRAAGSHVFLMPASSFRAALPPGPLSLDDLWAALPYPNKIVVAELSGAQLKELLGVSLAARGSGGFAQLAGLRYAIQGGQAVDVQVLAEPERPERGFRPLDAAARYRVASVDYLTEHLDGYRAVFAAAGTAASGLDVHTVLRENLSGALLVPSNDARVVER